MLKIYHNTMCSKSRCTLDLLKESGQPYELVEYLKNAPSETELKEILQKLHLKPEQLLRKGEKLFKEKFAGQTYSDEEWIKIMAQNPVLIERPIVINGDKAVIGRPPERILSIL
ncbi:arsenate reductase (glutaredoxin) [Adhaeribacter sp. BT258]|uniref:Arsenate reductase (Glutaredoxin) n=1 Tax=Adhaeribacter terrigena TaxID=2793070 RepID=A0ABS1BZ72_9BACT|nr:arsenate reductase (glutaredoxin) [Adhaeribacter terrigena]MBK0402462.1 arsenate reductase (glutaredoxin) [Adhaeribacter terrigena]